MSNSVHTNMPIVVRQRPWGLYVFIVGGAFFLFFPWALVREAPLWAKLLWNALGALAIAIGLFGLKYLRVTLIIDQVGIRIMSWSMPPRLLLIPWTQIEGVKLAHWTDIEGENEVVVIGLTHDAFANVTAGKSGVDRLRASFAKAFGPTRWEHPWVLDCAEWDEKPLNVVAAIEQALREPDFRSSLGQFAMAR